MHPRASRAVLTSTGALLLFGGIMAPLAGAAGSYSVWSCRGPDGAPLSTAAWQPIEGGAATSDTCAAGGSLTAALRQSDGGPGRLRGYRFALPPGARIDGYRIHLSATSANAAADNVFQAGLDRDPDAASPQIDAGCPVDNCVFGIPDQPLADANLIAADGTGVKGLAAATVCARPRGCAELVGDKLLAQVRLYRSEVMLHDDEAPALEPVAGLPGDGEVVASPRAVGVAAGDGAGGVAALLLLVDGREVARHDAGGACRQPYAQVAPCPGRLSATLPLGTESLAPGAHSVIVRAVDAAGNEASSGAVAFIAAAPPASAVAGVGLQRIVQVVTAVPRRVTIHPTRSLIALSVPGSRGSIAGIVRDAAGRPVAGVKVTVRSRPFGVLRAKLRLERTLTSDAHGRFATLAAGVSRLVVLDVNSTAFRAQEPVEVRLMQRLRVTARSLAGGLRNGSTLTLGAGIQGAGGGAAGKTVLVQALVGDRWTTVDSLTIGSAGTTRWHYRFRATTRRVVYRFRLEVERAGDVWPWQTTVSKVLTVEVSP